VRLSPEQIETAVADTRWQEFRVGLKGQTTRAKLEKLLAYVDEYNSETTGEGTGWLMRLIRVQNYLNALARGGQIRPTNKDISVRKQILEAQIKR